MIRILLVDDQKSIRERLKSLLETEPDFDIVGMVDNGYDAIEQVKLLLPDVVLMDMEMPDIDGVLATQRFENICLQHILILLPIWVISITYILLLKGSCFHRSQIFIIR